jgi:hypothetical protein
MFQSLIKFLTVTFSETAFYFGICTFLISNSFPVRPYEGYRRSIDRLIDWSLTFPLPPPRLQVLLSGKHFSELHLEVPAGKRQRLHVKVSGVVILF